MTSYSPRLDGLERNLIINGNMDFWQRGTSFTGLTSTSTQYCADRMRYNTSGAAGLYRVDQDATDVPTFAQSKFTSRYSLKVSCTTADAGPTGFSGLTYRFEGQDAQEIYGKNIRVQFWVKSNLTGTFSFGVRSGDQNRSYVTTYTINSANTWEKKVLDIPLETGSSTVYPIDNTMGLQFSWALADGLLGTSNLNVWQAGNFISKTGQVNFGSSTSNVFRIAQVQAIPQDFVTNSQNANIDIPFSRCGRNVAHELQMCQRYYEKSYDVDTAPGSNTAAGLYQTTLTCLTGGPNSYAGLVQYKATKRIVPTVVFYRFSTGATNNWDTVAASTTSTSRTGMVANCSGLSSFEPQFSGLSTTDILAFGHWAADAEL